MAQGILMNTDLKGITIDEVEQFRQELLNSLEERFDLVPVMMGILTILTIMYIIALIIIDISYGLLDPRIRH